MSGERNSAVAGNPYLQEVEDGGGCGCSAMSVKEEGPCGSREFHDTSTMMMRCCGGSGVNNVDACPIPVG
jgi:hypothetical protein